jgi:hypothetical protein
MGKGFVPVADLQKKLWGPNLPCGSLSPRLESSLSRGGGLELSCEWPQEAKFEERSEYRNPNTKARLEIEKLPIMVLRLIGNPTASSDSTS